MHDGKIIKKTLGTIFCLFENHNKFYRLVLLLFLDSVKKKVFILFSAFHVETNENCCFVSLQVEREKEKQNVVNKLLFASKLFPWATQDNRNNV